MRDLVYGAGAVGGVIGGNLFRAGREVTLLARGRHLVRDGGEPGSMDAEKLPAELRNDESPSPQG